MHTQKSWQLVRQIKGGGQAELPFAKHPPHTISYTFDFQTLCPPHRRPHVDGPVTSPYTCDSTNVPAVCSHGKLRACQTALANCPPRPLTHPQAVCCRRAVCSHGKLRACQTLANCPPRPLTHPQTVCCRRAVCSHGKLRACQTALANCPPRPLTHPQAVCCRRAVCSHGKLPHGLSACTKGGSRRLTCGGTGASSHGHANTRENSTLPGTCTRRSSHA